MRINKLTLENFKQFKQTEITFPYGLIGFIGKNGAGKSTIFEAILYALYGNERGGKENYRNQFAGEKEAVTVTLSFSEGENEYLIKRELRGVNQTAKAKIFINGIETASDTKPVTQAVQRLLKLTRQNFKNSFFAAQKDVTALLTMRNADRQIELRRLLGFERLDKLEKQLNVLAREQNTIIELRSKDLLTERILAELESELAKLQQTKTEQQEKLSSMEKEKERISMELGNAAAALSSHETKHGQNSIVKLELTALTERIKSTGKALEDANGQLAKYEAYKDELTALQPVIKKFAELTAELERLNRERAKFREKEGLQNIIGVEEKNIFDLNEQIEKNTAVLKNKPEIERLLQEQKSALEACEAKLEILRKEKEKAGKNAAELGGALKQKNDRYAKVLRLGKDAVCPECERPLEEHFSVLCAEYQGSIAGLQKAYNEAQTESAACDTSIQSADANRKKAAGEIGKIEKQLTEIKTTETHNTRALNEKKTKEKKLLEYRAALNTLKDVTFSEAEFNAVDKEHRSLKEVDSHAIELEADIKKIPNLQESISKLQKDAAGFAKQKTKVEESIRTIAYQAEEHENAKKLRETKQKEKDAAVSASTEALLAVKNTESQIALKTESITRNDALKKEVAVLKVNTERMEKLLEVVGVFKVTITSSEIPLILNDASSLFSQLTENRYLNFSQSEESEFIIMREGKQAFVSTLSGGEKDLLSLCLRVAVSRRIALLAGRNNLGFLALDEVFGSQDELRRSELMKALHTLSKSFCQIFVISHNQDVQEQFEQRIEIKKNSTYSEVKTNFS